MPKEVEGVTSNVSLKGVIEVEDTVKATYFGEQDFSLFATNTSPQDMPIELRFLAENEQITLMGQSAGAISIQTLVCTDALKGKIKGAVMLSGGRKRTGLLPLSKPNKRYWAKLTRECGATTFEEKDYAISNDMVDRFVAFAKTQNSNVSGEDWRTYHGKKDIKVWE